MAQHETVALMGIPNHHRHLDERGLLFPWTNRKIKSPLAKNRLEDPWCGHSYRLPTLRHLSLRPITTALLTTAPKMPRRAGFQRAQSEQIVDLPLPPSLLS